MKDKGKIYFASDVHLGAPAFKNNRERELLFAHWLDSINNDVRELFLMGDIFDFWWEYKKVVPRGFTRILGRIANLTDRGIPVHFFPGNHDLWVFDYLPDELGVIVHRDAIIREIDGKKFYLAHGDGLDAEDKGYIRLKKIFTNKKLQWWFSRLHPNFALYIAHKWSGSSRTLKLQKNEEEFNVNNDGMFKFAQSFLQHDSIDYFIFGHRHKMANVRLNEKTTFVLLGDWISYYSYGVFDGKEFKLNVYNKDIES